MNQTDGILLESGTNELEIILFKVGRGLFGINVLKVREIIQPLPITKTPNDHEHIEGVIRLRDEVIPVVDLAKVLQCPPSETPEEDKFIIAELNKIKVAFHVHGVSRIERISWQQIEKTSDLQAGAGHTIGIVKLNEEMPLLLDFEKILIDIHPDLGINKDDLKGQRRQERTKKKIVIAEDSAMLRMHLEETLKEAGYENLRFFENGQAAWDYLEQLAQQGDEAIREKVDLIITDIEMPKMDGHHLTKRIKDDDRLKAIPVVIFSSLITNDLFHKGESVGADDQISKPEIANLVKSLDRFLLKS